MYPRDKTRTVFTVPRAGAITPENLNVTSQRVETLKHTIYETDSRLNALTESKANLDSDSITLPADCHSDINKKNGISCDVSLRFSQRYFE